MAEWEGRYLVMTWKIENFFKNLLGLNCHEGDHAEHEIFHIVLRIAVIRVKELKL